MEKTNVLVTTENGTEVVEVNGATSYAMLVEMLSALYPAPFTWRFLNPGEIL